MPENLVKRLSVARWKLLSSEPFLGYLALELPTHIHEGSGNPDETAFTDYKSYTFYRPFCDQLNDRGLLFLLAHEVGHVLMKHGIRREGRHPKGWNYAADYVFNGMLMKRLGPTGLNVAEMPSIDGKTLGLLNAEFDGMTTEQVYEILKSRRKKPMGGGGNAKDAQGDASGDAQGDAVDWGDGNILDPLTHTQEEQGRGDSPQTQQRMKEAIAKALHRAQELRKKQESLGQLRGDTGCDFERMAEEGFTPHPVWQEELRCTLHSRGKSRVNWARPRKKTLHLRYHNRPIFMPSRHGVSHGHIACVFDTSASVDTNCLSQFLAEINHLLKMSTDTTVHLFSCDAGVHDLGTFRAPQTIPADLGFTGGGGTSFAPAFDAVHKMARRGVQISQMLYFTDTYGTFPQKEPRFPVLWLVPDYDPNVSVPFGKLLRLPISPRNVTAA